MFDFNRPPLWVMEGFADFMTGYWESFNLMTVIDSVLSDRMPEMQEDGDIRADYGTNRTPYDFGHLMYEFFYEKFGKKGVRDLLLSMRRPAMIGKRRSFLEHFNFTRQDLQLRVQEICPRTLQGLHRPRESRRITVSSSAPIFLSPTRSRTRSRPGGELLAVVTVNYRTYKIDIILVSLKDGKVIKNVTPGFKSTYDGIDFKFIPSDGRTFSWDRQGENIAFFVRKELDSYLVMLERPRQPGAEGVQHRGDPESELAGFSPRARTSCYFTGSRGHAVRISIRPGPGQSGQVQQTDRRPHSMSRPSISRPTARRSFIRPASAISTSCTWRQASQSRPGHALDRAANTTTSPRLFR